MTDPPESRQVPVVWVGLDETPIQFANAILSQFQAGEFIVTFGQLSPPLLMGSDEQKRAQMDAVDFIPIKPVCRVGLTRRRLVELIHALQENLENHDRATGEAGQG